MAATVSVIQARSYSRLVGKGGKKTLSLTYPYSQKFRGVKSGDRSGQAVVPPRPIQTNFCRETRGDHIENLWMSADKI